MPLPSIMSGSYSRLEKYENCPRRAKLEYIDKIPEPDRGPPPRNLKEWPNDRGSRIHDECDAFVRGNGSLPHEVEEWAEEFEKLQELFKKGTVIPEEMWCFDDNWLTCPPRSKKVFFRIKADCVVFFGDEDVLLIDYKTGRRKGNEVKHAQQLQIYAIGAFLRYEKLKSVSTELWYLDLPEEDLHGQVFKRSQAMVLHRALKARMQMMTEAKIFPPRPNRFTCKWCPYGPAGTGDCRDGIQ